MGSRQRQVASLILDAKTNGQGDKLNVHLRSELDFYIVALFIVGVRGPFPLFWSD